MAVRFSVSLQVFITMPFPFVSIVWSYSFELKFSSIGKFKLLWFGLVFDHALVYSLINAQLKVLKQTHRSIHPTFCLQ